MSLSRMKAAGLLASILLALALAIAPACASDLVLHIPGISGNSNTPLHANDIAVQTLSFGIDGHTNNPVSIYVTKNLDKSSPLLASNLAAAVKFPSMTIFQTYTNGPVTNIMTLNLQNVFITSQTLSVHSGVRPVPENLTLQADSLTASYAQPQ